MTREEAISVLKETIDPNIDKSFKEWKEWDKEKHLPAVNMAIDALQAEPVKHGEWKYVANEIMKNRHGILGDIYGSPMFMNYECSECKFHIANDLKGISDHRTAYCPNCGAKMDGGKDGR